MLIKTVEVSRFRSIRGATLECESLTVLIGRNGAGKSSFLKALDVFYDVAAPITVEDFFNHDTSLPIEIRVTFGDLSPAEMEEFAPYVRDGSLTVTKRIRLEGNRVDQRYYAAAAQIPDFARIRQEPAKQQRIAAFRELVAGGSLPELSGSPRSADAVEELMAAYEREHPELLETIEREEQFFGPRNIGGGKLDKYTKFVHVPAVREAADEVGGRKGAIQQILDALVLRKLASREDVQAFRRDFEARAKELFGPATEAELEGVAGSLSRSLAEFAPGSALRLAWDAVAVPEVQPPAAKVTLVEDEFEGDIERKGHGLQRALVLTLLRELALLPPALSGTAGAEGATEGEPPDAAARTPAPSLIIAIEEPELFLHPSRCRYLHRLLAELTAPNRDPRNQVIYSTHSPHFVALRSFDQVRRIQKVRAPGGAAVPETTVRRFTLEQAALHLAEICEADPSSFTRDSFAARTLPLMTQTVSDGFFADAVVLVEGPSEMAALWKLQEILAEGWDERGIAVIPVGGKTNLDRPAVIFRGLGIPVYIVFDADQRHRGKTDEERTRRTNRICLRLVGADLADLPDPEFPDTQVHDTWAVFEENLEAALERDFGKEALMEAVRVATEEVEFEADKDALKNVHIVAKVLEIAYERDLRADTLEDVVRCIGRLVPRW
jgi:hypothetical protein